MRRGHVVFEHITLERMASLCIDCCVVYTGNPAPPVTLTHKHFHPTLPPADTHTEPLLIISYSFWQLLFICNKHYQLSLSNSVVDPWHFGTDTNPNPDPRICTIDLLIRIRIRILLFRQWLTRCQRKVYLFFKVFLLITFWRYMSFTSVFIHKKSKRSHQNSRNQGFSYFICLLMEVSGSGSRSRTGSVQNNVLYGPGRLKNIRIRIHNTALHKFSELGNLGRLPKVAITNNSIATIFWKH